MIENICLWLPPIIEFDEYENNWLEYNSHLHNIFLRDFINDKPVFQGKKVEVRINPTDNGVEHAFIHLTCISKDTKADINDRTPDFRRCERIEWNRKIIENYNCLNNCSNCKKISYYEQYYKNTIRIILLFSDVRFKIILEKRKNYFLLITGYYMQYNNVIEKELKKVYKYNQQKMPLD